MGVLRNESLLQERTGRGRMLVFFVMGTGYRQTQRSRPEEGEKICMYANGCSESRQSAGLERPESFRKDDRGFSTLLGGSVRPSGSASSAWSLRHRFLLRHQLLPARGSSL